MDVLLTNLLQYTIDGALRGMLYAVIALAFIVIYRAGRILNFAQGEIVIFGGYLIFTFFSWKIFPFWIALAFSFAMAVFLGLLIERIIFRPLIGQPIWAIVMVTIGLMILLQGITLVIWGGSERPFPVVFPRAPVKLGKLTFTGVIFWGGMLSFFIIFVLSWLFEKTRWGLKLTAVAEDHQVAQSMGISVRKSIAIAWVFGCVLSSFSAIVFLNGQTLTVGASMIGLQALPVVLLAGLESIWGAPLAGIMVGVGESLAAAYLDPHTGGAMSEAFPYLIMLVSLLIRPQGLFGWKIIERI
jgi:branched-chain amino acid transport system permease protein